MPVAGLRGRRGRACFKEVNFRLVGIVYLDFAGAALDRVDADTFLQFSTKVTHTDARLGRSKSVGAVLALYTLTSESSVLST